MEQARQVPPLLRKILATTMSGGTTLLITVLSEQSLITSINLSVLVGGVALLVEFLLEFETRLTELEKALEAHSSGMRTLVESGFAQVSEATRLFNRMEKSRLGTGVVGDLVRNVSEIGEDGPEIVRGFARREIRRLAALMKELQAGQAAYDGEDQDWLLTLTHSASVGIDAISTAVDIGFWNSELGRRYLEAQRAAVRRGVPVRRVFVLKHPDQESMEETMRVSSTQATLGLSVRTVAMSDLPSWARRPMSDFIVFDAAISYEVNTDEGEEQLARPMIASTLLVLSEDKVAKRIQRFEDLWAVAQPVLRRTP